MAIRTSDSGKDILKTPSGTHIGRCFCVIDIGTHSDGTYGNAKHKVLIGWELPEIPRADQKPQTIYKRYTLSHNSKAILRADLESWYGQRFDDKQLNAAGGFDLERLINRPALLNVVHSQDGKYANIAAIMPLPKSMPCADLHSETLVFSLDPFKQEDFDGLPAWMQNVITKSEEYQAMIAAAHGGGRTSTLGMTKDQMAGQGHPAFDDVPFGPPGGAAPAPDGRRPNDFDNFEDDIPF